MTLEQSLKIMRTVWYLRPSQVFWRIYYSLERMFKFDSGYRTKQTETNIHINDDFPVIPLRDTQQSGISLQKLSQGIFKHFNAEHKLGLSSQDWDLEGSHVGRLWSIHHDYHQWLFELAEIATNGEGEADTAFDLFVHYLEDWLTTHNGKSIDKRTLTWNSYGVATRISWWVRSYQQLASGKRSLNPDLLRSFLESLWRQAGYLSGHLEYDLRANHLLRDAVGLAFAGRFLRGRQPTQWLKVATSLGVDQAREQVLPDGGHFERSVMYHIEAMADILTLSVLVQDEQARSELKSTWLRMAEFLSWARHPDGMIPLFNDAAFNGSDTPDKMLKNGSTCGCEAKLAPRKGGILFPDYGLVCWHDKTWTVFFDVGPVGVDYQPGHSHADTLSIEASFRGQRLFVDPGTWGYDLDGRRIYDRSTKAHNTLCVDDSDSSEVWHIFRCGRRAYPQRVNAQFERDGFWSTASHSGYLHLYGKPCPSRELHLRGDSTLIMRDICGGSEIHTLSSGLLLAPGWRTQRADNGWKISRDDCGSLQISIRGPSNMRLQESICDYHPEFGKEETTTRLEWIFRGNLPVTVVTEIRPR
jgi:hypothetical protein